MIKKKRNHRIAKTFRVNRKALKRSEKLRSNFASFKERPKR